MVSDRTKDYPTWFLEVVPALIGVVLMALTWKRFRLTGLLYTLIFTAQHRVDGGRSLPYAEVPLFDWIKALLWF